MAGRRHRLEAHLWWLLATLIVSVAITVVTGWFLLPVYSAANAAGTMLYLDRLGRAPVRRIVLPILTALQIPVGLLSTLLWRRADPVEAILTNEEYRVYTAASNHIADRRRYLGGPG